MCKALCCEGRYSPLKGLLHFLHPSLFTLQSNGLNLALGSKVLLGEGEHQQDQAQTLLLANPASRDKHQQGLGMLQTKGPGRSRVLTCSCRGCELRRTLRALCFCLIRAVSAPSLLRHRRTSKRRDNQREELLILCPMLKITSKVVFKDRGLAAQKADLWEEVRNAFPCWIYPDC